MNSQDEDRSANTADDEASSSIELNLRLDENGRTTFDPATVHQIHQIDAAKDAAVDDANNNNIEQPSKRAKTAAQSESSTLDYSSKTVLTNLHGCKSQDAMDSLLFDCEVSDASWQFFLSEFTCLFLTRTIIMAL
jgi:hypothetical protein